MSEKCHFFHIHLYTSVSKITELGYYSAWVFPFFDSLPVQTRDRVVALGAAFRE